MPVVPTIKTCAPVSPLFLQSFQIPISHEDLTIPQPDGTKNSFSRVHTGPHHPFYYVGEETIMAGGKKRGRKA